MIFRLLILGFSSPSFWRLWNFKLVYLILANTATTKEVVPLTPFVSFRRPKNLKDNLVRLKLPKFVESSGPKGMQPSGKSRCQKCRLVSGLDTFQDSDFKPTYFINYKFDCDSKDVFVSSEW